MTPLEKLNSELQTALGEVYVGESRVYVWGQGPQGASIALVGEAPGEQETLEGRPFVGKAGKNLDAFLEILQMPRERLYITNAVKFRPVRVSEKSGKPVNRTPSKEEIALFAPYLLRELALVQPKVVVTLGNVPLRAVLGRGDRASIGQAHGQWMDKGAYWLFPLYHPASVIYNRALQEVYVKDLHVLREGLGERGLNV